MFLRGWQRIKDEFELNLVCFKQCIPDKAARPYQTAHVNLIPNTSRLPFLLLKNLVLNATLGLNILIALPII